MCLRFSVCLPPPLSYRNYLKTTTNRAGITNKKTVQEKKSHKSKYKHTSEVTKFVFEKIGIKMNLSFAGCGFLGIYHVGVGICIQKYAPHLLLNQLSGASAGALAACCLLCKIPLCTLTNDILTVAIEARKHRLGAFNPKFNITKILRRALERSLPENAHEIVTGKLNISLTRMSDGKNVLVSDFESKEHLIQVLVATTFIPMFSGTVPPSLNGQRYVDGCFTDNLPTLDENTVTISPFCGESDICPRDDTSQLLHLNLSNTSIEISKTNAYRMIRILFPPKPEALANLCWQGFDDALRFMKKNDLIKCEECAFGGEKNVKREVKKDEEKADCEACRRHQVEAHFSMMPPSVIKIFEQAIEKSNDGFFNKIFNFKGMKLLSYLALPALFPMDILHAFVTKLVTSAPNLGTNLWETTQFILELIKKILNTICSVTSNASSAAFSPSLPPFCGLAISELNSP